MRERPTDLTDDSLRACLHDQYGLTITQFAFLSLGHDSSAWKYRAQAADGRAYFLKVRAGVANVASLLVPRALRDGGVARIVAPLPTVAGTLWAVAGDYTAILYPFVAGATGMERGMSERQWTTYGALLRQVHETVPAPDLLRVLGRETFAPDGADMVRRLDAQIGARTFADPAAQGLATFWQARRADIRTLLARAEALGQQIARETPPLVLCHADIHTNNVLVDNEGEVWFVDWDDTLLAPRERDLMFVIGGLRGGLVSPQEEAHFFAGYGTTAIDPLALAYYRYARAVSDLGYEGEQVLFRPDLDPATRQEATDRVRRLFQPGYLVALALASDAQGA